MAVAPCPSGCGVWPSSQLPSLQLDSPGQFDCWGREACVCRPRTRACYSENSPPQRCLQEGFGVWAWPEPVEGTGTDAEPWGRPRRVYRQLERFRCLPSGGDVGDGQLCPLSSLVAWPSLPAGKELIFKTSAVWPEGSFRPREGCLSSTWGRSSYSLSCPFLVTHCQLRAALDSDRPAPFARTLISCRCPGGMGSVGWSGTLSDAQGPSQSWSCPVPLLPLFLVHGHLAFS